MTRIVQTALVAALVFVIGFVSGSIVSLKFGTPKSISQSTNSVVETKPTPTLVEFTREESWESFSQRKSGDGQSGADLTLTVPDVSGQIETVSASEDHIVRSDDNAVRRTIRKFYPDLDEDVLSGWVDSYRGMPLGELKQMLEQQHLMPQLVLPRSFLSEKNLIEETLRDDVESPLVSSVKEQILQANLRNANTVGYRRRVVFSAFPIPSAHASFVPQREEVQFAFDEGPIRPSNSKLHVGIRNCPNAMFQLEPGGILTRNGMFEHLPDGSIGLQHNDLMLAVAGTDKVSANARQIQILPDGTVQYTDSKGETQTAGKILLTHVDSLENMTSENGVYFSPSEKAVISNQAVEEGSLVVGAVEISNVDSASEWQSLENCERLKQLQ